MKKFCPLKFTQVAHLPDGEPTNPDWSCEYVDCAWFNERFGMCSQAVDAHIKGIAHQRVQEFEARERRERACMATLREEQED